MVDFVKILNEHEIAPSIQRIKILEYLYNYKTHPTADMIYRDLVKDIPTLSKTTVYNTLKTFTEKGILTALQMFDHEIRYDYDTDHHIHFKCDHCGKVYDLGNHFQNFKGNEIEGHSITEHHVNFRGTCKFCRELKDQEK